MRLRLVGLLLVMPACGSILGVGPLDTPEDELTDGGTTKDAATAPIDSGTTTITLPDGGDGGVVPNAVRPPDGDYEYSVVSGGNDNITLNGVDIAKHTYSAPKISISHQTETCFTEVVALRSDYVDTLSTYCVNGPLVTLIDDHRTQVFNGFANADTTSTCTGESPDAGTTGPGDVYFTTQPNVGDQWVHTCRGSNTANDSAAGASNDTSNFLQTGEYQYLETIPVPVNGQAVPTYHFKVDLQVSGAQTGTNTTEIYMSTMYALPVRFVRSIHITYPTSFGTATYDETVDMTLKSPPPPPGG